MKPNLSCAIASHLSYFIKLRMESKGRRGIHPCSPPAARKQMKKKRSPDERIREANALMMRDQGRNLLFLSYYSAINVMLTVAETISFAACTTVPYPVSVAAPSMRLAEKLPTLLS